MGVERLGSRASERRRSVVSLTSALLVHALLFGVLSVPSPESTIARAPAPPVLPGMELELIESPPDMPPDTPQLALERKDTRSLGELGDVGEPHAPDRPSARAPRAAPQQAAPTSAPDPTIDVQREGDSDLLAAGSAAPGAQHPAPRAQHPAPRAPGLSLDDLGIGATNPFIERGASEGPFDPKSAAQITRRVDRVLADGIANGDQRRGLGPEGPLIASLERAARQSLTPPNSTALFRLSTDGSGMLVGVQVIDANSDQAIWQKLGDRVLSTLGKTRLRGSHGANGLTFEIRVISRAALPSGRDPGLQLDILGLSLQKPKGAKNATRIGILDLPKYSVQKVALPDGRTIEVPMITVSAFEVNGDPVDIGAPAQRIVHARLERLWAN
jgi:hypothetical protein